MLIDDERRRRPSGERLGNRALVLVELAVAFESYAAPPL